MSIYRLYFMFLKKHPLQLVIHLFVFLIFVLNDMSQVTTKGKMYEMGIVCEEDTPLVEGLKTYLGSHVKLIIMKNEEEKVQDQLAFCQVISAIKIPEGFTVQFEKGGMPQLIWLGNEEKEIFYHSQDLIETYLRKAAIYKRDYPQLQEKEWIEKVNDSLGEGHLEREDQISLRKTDLKIYFDYFSYGLTAILLTGIMSVMNYLKQEPQKSRRACAPLEKKEEMIQLIKSDCLFGGMTLSILSSIAFIVIGKEVFSLQGGLMLLNACVLMIVIICLAHLYSLFSARMEEQIAFTLLTALGGSFIGGTFITQLELSGKVHTIASFTPFYWYIKINEAISQVGTIYDEKLRLIGSDLLIEGGFAICLIAIILMIDKQKNERGEEGKEEVKCPLF